MEAGISLREILWNDDIERRLAPTVIDEPTYSIANLRAEVLRGTSKLVGGFRAGQLEGVMVYFVDVFGGEAEFVLQAGVGMIGDKAALQRYYPLLEQVARAHQCAAIRTHLARDTYIPIYGRLGFRKSETVMRKAL